MRTLIISLGITILAGVSCTSERQHPNTEVIDYNSFVEENLDDLQNLQYILLKIPQGDSKIRNISQVKIFEHKLYVSDNVSKSFFVFNLEGDPLAEIGRRGRGPGEYLSISDFDFDENGFIHILDAQANKILIFNSDYTFVTDVRLPFQVDIIKCLPADKYLLGLSSWNRGEVSDFQIIACIFIKRRVHKNVVTANYAFGSILDRGIEKDYIYLFDGEITAEVINLISD